MTLADSRSWASSAYHTTGRGPVKHLIGVWPPVVVGPRSTDSARGHASACYVARCQGPSPERRNRCECRDPVQPAIRCVSGPGRRVSRYGTAGGGPNCGPGSPKATTVAPPSGKALVPGLEPKPFSGAGLGHALSPYEAGMGFLRAVAEGARAAAPGPHKPHNSKPGDVPQRPQRMGRHPGRRSVEALPVRLFPPPPR